METFVPVAQQAHAKFLKARWAATNVDENESYRRNLLKAIAALDGNAFELAVSAAFQAGLPIELADIFTEALTMTWHTRHEDLASALQQMKAPESIDALHAAAVTTHAYLDYDEFFGLARTCTWALADIGTPTARDKLTALAKHPNSVIAGYARQRLERWEEELPRKVRQR